MTKLDDLHKTPEMVESKAFKIVAFGIYIILIVFVVAMLYLILS